jgi:hypothetical protein
MPIAFQSQRDGLCDTWLCGHVASGLAVGPRNIHPQHDTDPVAWNRSRRRGLHGGTLPQDRLFRAWRDVSGLACMQKPEGVDGQKSRVAHLFAASIAGSPVNL